VQRVDHESMVIQDLLNAYDREELDISPWYQRRAVWTNAHKSYLINSIFSNMPVPTIYIRHTLDLENERTIKEVVDGQQRVRSVIDYRDNKFAARHPDHPRRIYYRSLTPTQRQHFLMSKLSVAYLIDADDSDVIEIFGRLNAVSKTLNAQEKRSAQYSGEFHQFCLRESVDRLPLWRDLHVFTATEISRMAEVQFLAELCMALLLGPQDSSAPKIDAAYKQWDEDFPERDVLAGRLDRVFSAVASLNPEAIRDTIFSRSPLFYTLILVLDSMERLPSRVSLQQSLHDIDERFHDERPANQRPKLDVEFVAACTASTQRIKSRDTRFAYVKSFI